MKKHMKLSRLEPLQKATIADQHVTVHFEGYQIYLTTDGLDTFPY